MVFDFTSEIKYKLQFNQIRKMKVCLYSRIDLLVFDQTPQNNSSILLMSKSFQYREETLKDITSHYGFRINKFFLL